MLPLSYATASAAMLATGLYLLLRLRPFVMTTTMLLGSLLLVYGPTCLVFTLCSGEFYYLIRPLASGYLPPSMFPAMAAKVGDLGPVITDINFSLTLMYLGIIAGMEAANGMLASRAKAMQEAVAGWSNQDLKDDVRVHRLLLIAIAACFVLMLCISIKEDHAGIIERFFSITNDNNARNLFRAEHGGSPNYLYRVILSAIAPMLVIWGVLAGTLTRSWPLLIAALLLLLVTMLGKIETLSKAPPAFFLLQVILAAYLAFTNRVSWRTVLVGGLFCFVVVYATTRMIILFSPSYSSLETVYSRIFETESQTLVENFAVFPRLHPHTWGANIRPLAAMMGWPYTPSFSLVSEVWYNDHNITSPTLFIADAWADFSYAGVLVFSILAGGICRAIDVMFLSNGKSVVGIATLCATFWGVLTLITTSLNIALVTGGLLLAPALAAMLMAASRLRSPRVARAS